MTMATKSPRSNGIYKQLNAVMGDRKLKQKKSSKSLIAQLKCLATNTRPNITFDSYDLNVSYKRITEGVGFIIF